MFNTLWYKVKEDGILFFSKKPYDGLIEKILTSEEEEVLKNPIEHIKVQNGMLILDNTLHEYWLDTKELKREFKQIKNYLRETDWVVIKRLELNEERHSEIVAERASKRIRLQELQELIN